MSAPLDLHELVSAWLPTQRWYAGKGRPATIRTDRLASLSPEVTIWLAEVDYLDGDVELYQLPLTELSEPDDTLEHVLLGTVERDGAPRWVYDALHHKDVTDSWLEAIRDDAVVDGLHFHRVGEPDLIPVGKPSLVSTGEQSNTSLMYGDIAILKVYRRLQPGINPDIELGRGLAEHGARHVPALMGDVSATYRGEQYAIAMLQEFMTTATDGWELAKASVRDLMAEADLHAEEAGGDFAGEAFRLGNAVAEVHADLAAAFGAGPDIDVAARAADMHARLDQALPVVPGLVELELRLRALFDEFAALSYAVTTQRIHGDLHLGQALRTSHRWVLIDFEGEPMADLGTRRLPDSPLRDVAGMLRSFEYAGHHRILETGYQPQLAYRAAEWTTRNRTAFCDGYAEVAGHDPRAHDVALRAYEADKAVYETVYEARNRPAWLALPLASLAGLTEPEGEAS